MRRTGSNCANRKGRRFETCQWLLWHHSRRPARRCHNPHLVSKARAPAHWPSNAVFEKVKSPLTPPKPRSDGPEWRLSRRLFQVLAVENCRDIALHLQKLRPRDRDETTSLPSCLRIFSRAERSIRPITRVDALFHFHGTCRFLLPDKPAAKGTVTFSLCAPS